MRCTIYQRLHKPFLKLKMLLGINFFHVLFIIYKNIKNNYILKGAGVQAYSRILITFRRISKVYLLENKKLISATSKMFDDKLPHLSNQIILFRSFCSLLFKRYAIQTNNYG